MPSGPAKAPAAKAGQYRTPPALVPAAAPGRPNDFLPDTS